MTTIEKMAETLLIGLDAINPETSPKTHALVSKAIDDYQAGKFLFEKTQAYHERGTVAPSCVGCPAAENAIRKDDYCEQKIKKVCAKCGSEDVKFDAYAAWNVEEQKMEVVMISDKGHVCEDCGGPCRIVDVPVRKHSEGH